MSIKIFKQPQTQRAYYNKYQNMYNNNVYKIGIHFSSLELFIKILGFYTDASQFVYAYGIKLNNETKEETKEYIDIPVCYYTFKYSG